MSKNNHHHHHHRHESNDNIKSLAEIELSEITHEDITTVSVSSASTVLTISDTEQWNSLRDIFIKLSEYCDFNVAVHEASSKKVSTYLKRLKWVSISLPILLTGLTITNPPQQLKGVATSDEWKIALYVATTLISLSLSFINKISSNSEAPLLLKAHLEYRSKFLELSKKMKKNMIQLTDVNAETQSLVLMLNDAMDEYNTLQSGSPSVEQQIIEDILTFHMFEHLRDNKAVINGRSSAGARNMQQLSVFAPAPIIPKKLKKNKTNTSNVHTDIENNNHHDKNSHMLMKMENGLFHKAKNNKVAVTKTDSELSDISVIDDNYYNHKNEKNNCEKQNDNQKEASSSINVVAAIVNNNVNNSSNENVVVSSSSSSQKKSDSNSPHYGVQRKFSLLNLTPKLQLTKP